jgi:hypothetical protein
MLIVDLNNKEIPIKMALFGFVFQLREVLAEHVYTCLYTNFYFEHNGERLNDYTTLSELDLSANPRIFMMPGK